MEELDDAYLISSDMFKRKVYDRIMRETERRLGKQKYLITDATFYRKRWRDRLREITSDEERAVTIFIDCSLETCLERNREREKPIPEEAIHIIWNKFERLDDYDIYINTEKVGISKAVDIILRQLQIP